VAERAERAVVERGVFSLAVSGGRTPGPLFDALAQTPYRFAIEWPRVELYLVDERYVPSTDSQSNFRIVRETLLDRVPIPAGRIHRWKTELAPAEALADYERQLGVLPREPESGAPPRLDLIVLGIGTDGHTASLFPGTPALEERSRWVVEGRAPSAPEVRLSMSLPLLNAARTAAFLVTGPEKAALVRDILAGGAEQWPAALVRPAGGPALWFLDVDAAALLAKEAG
jgi:6-phosphogluconolactonase